MPPGQALSEEPGFRFNGLGGMGPYLGLARLLVRDPCYFLHRSQVLPESLSGPASAWSLLLLGLARLLVRDRYYFTRGSQRKRFCAGQALFRSFSPKVQPGVEPRSFPGFPLRCTAPGIWGVWKLSLAWFHGLPPPGRLKNCDPTSLVFGRLF